MCGKFIPKHERNKSVSEFVDNNFALDTKIKEACRGFKAEIDEEIVQEEIDKRIKLKPLADREYSSWKRNDKKGLGLSAVKGLKIYFDDDSHTNHTFWH